MSMLSHNDNDNDTDTSFTFTFTSTAEVEQEEQEESSSSQSWSHNPLHIELRDWELGPNNTIFDNLRAAPSDEDLLWQWGLLVGLSVVALVGILLVFGAIWRDRKCRKNSFNVYILFLMVPDILFTSLGIMTTSLNIAHGSFYSLTHCHLQSFYSVFTVSASSWLNAILAWQLHSMLKASNQHRRYKPPTRRRALKHGLLVFAWSAFVASWTSWPAKENSWWPIRTELYSGAFCLPMAYDNISLAFLFLVFGPCCFVVPFLYICWVVIDILWKQLLPPKEKRKRLLIFFGLIITYFFIWVPTIVLTYILGYWMTSWYTYFGAVWGVSQGFISAAVCLLKADIQQAVRKLLGWQADDSNDPTRMSAASNHGGGRSESLGQSYIHTSSFGLDGNSMHSMASSSVIDLSVSREVTNSYRSNNNNSNGNNGGGGGGGGRRSTNHSLSGSFQTGGSKSSKSFTLSVDGCAQSDDTIPEVDEDEEMDESSSSFANESVLIADDEHNDEHDGEHDGEHDAHYNNSNSNKSLESSFRSVGMDGKVTLHGSRSDDDDGDMMIPEEQDDEDRILDEGNDSEVSPDDIAVVDADMMECSTTIEVARSGNQKAFASAKNEVDDDDDDDEKKEDSMIAMEEGNSTPTSEEEGDKAKWRIEDSKVVHT